MAELTLDPTSFPDAAFLQQPENLGRLQVSAVDGDANGDGRYGRSFGIWTGDGKLVFDSGSISASTTCNMISCASTSSRWPPHTAI